MIAAGPMRHLLDVEGMARPEAEHLLALAVEMRAARAARRSRDLLERETVATAFYEASTRTRVSFELAAKVLGATTVDLAIEDADPQTGVGELLIRGGNVVAGYWNKPDATSATFDKGWLHTGDMARLSPEGFTYIVDRAKDMINRGGENVYCVEVENALAAAPGVFEVAVIGVPDDMMGEKVGAVLVPTPGSRRVVSRALVRTDAAASIHCQSVWLPGP